MIIVSNGQWADPERIVQVTGHGVKLVVSNIGCKGWQGSVIRTHESKEPGVWLKETLSASSVSFERARTDPRGSWPQLYASKQTNVYWEYTGTIGRCRIEATPLDLVTREGDATLSIIHTADLYQDDIGLVSAGGIVLGGYETELREICPDGTLVVPYLMQDWLSIDSLRVSADGMSIVGTDLSVSPPRTRTSQVHFTAIPRSRLRTGLTAGKGPVARGWIGD